jgi:hypothetical protein
MWLSILVNNASVKKGATTSGGITVILSIPGKNASVERVVTILSSITYKNNILK